MNATDAPFSAVAAYELDTEQRLLFTKLHQVGVHEGNMTSYQRIQ
jgi:hypothetical protein